MRTGTSRKPNCIQAIWDGRVEASLVERERRTWGVRRRRGSAGAAGVSRAEAPGGRSDPAWQAGPCSTRHWWAPATEADTRSPTRGGRQRRARAPAVGLTMQHDTRGAGSPNNSGSACASVCGKSRELAGLSAGSVETLGPSIGGRKLGQDRRVFRTRRARIEGGSKSCGGGAIVRSHAQKPGPNFFQLGARSRQ